MNLMLPETIATRLAEVFTRIERERMRDVPLLNRNLRVEAVGFRAWGGESAIGVLITPWFMNLMLVAGSRRAWRELPPGGTVSHTFPAGSCEFTVGEEDSIGRYQMCSLFSPVFEFGDQAVAVATAEAFLRRLFTADDTPGGRSRQAACDPDGGTAGRRRAPEAFMNPVLARRDFLRGAFLRTSARRG